MINSFTDTILLNDGYRIPGFGLGTWDIKAGDEAYNYVRAALDIGYRHIDTASLYLNEEDVGKAIRESGVPREEIFVTSKIWPEDFANAEEVFFDSYNKIGLDYLDMFMLHWPGIDEELRYRAWDVILEQREKGLIRSAGVSNFLPVHLDQMIEKTGVTPVNN